MWPTVQMSSVRESEGRKKQTTTHLNSDLNIKTDKTKQNKQNWSKTITVHAVGGAFRAS